MDYLELAAARNSCRKYTAEQISESDLEKIILAANAAPIGSSRFQDIHLTVVQNREVLDKLAEAVWARFADKETIKKIIGDVQGKEIPTRGKQDPFYGAPTVIFISHKEQDLQPGIEFSNAACVAYSMHLEATQLGLGSVFMWGSLEAARVLPEHDNTAVLQAPPGFKPLLGLAIGHRAVEGKTKILTNTKMTINRIS